MAEQNSESQPEKKQNSKNQLEKKQPEKKTALHVEQEINATLLALSSKLDFILPPGVSALVPGLLLTCCISAIAIYTGAHLRYVTPLIVAMGIGVLFRNAFILPSAYNPGIIFSMRRVLRFAVALLGVRITFEQIQSLGLEGAAIALVPLVLTYVLTVVIGKLMKADESQSMLIATGTSICGASAIMTAGAVTRATSDNVMVAVSSITVFGTFSMLVYPVLYKSGLLDLTATQYGYWAGASVHEVAQAVAAAFGIGGPDGELSGNVGTIIKLTRVAALVPFAFFISYMATRGFVKSEGSAAPGEVKLPLFLFGFLAMVLLNSYNFFTPHAVKWIETTSAFLLTVSMAAMGLETDFGKLVKIGFRPFFLSVISTGFIAAFSLFMVKMLIKP